MSRLAVNTTGLSRLNWTAGIVVGASLPHWSRLPIWMPVLLLACVTWRYAARLLRWPLPGRWPMRLLTVGAFGAVLIEFRTINGLTPGTALLIVMISLKFLEARTQRDQILLTVIAYFLVFAQALAGGQLYTGIYLLGFAWLTTIALLQVGRQGALLPNLVTARLAARLLLPALPVMVVLFALFPRMPGPIWSLPGDNTSGVTGLSGSMSPGDITNLGLSDEIAFRVRFAGPAPAASELYWRGPVLTNFDGRTWRRPQGQRGSVADTVEGIGDQSDYRVTLEPGSRGYAFALEMPTSWSTDDRRQSVRMNSEYQLGIGPPDIANGRVSYNVTSFAQFRAREQLSRADIVRLTQLPPEGNPKTRALVASLQADAPDSGTLVERALDVFRDDGFFYTLTPPALGEDTADEFIFDTKEGFCEHYASAFAIMMRMAGLPARVVTGYQGGDLNEYGDYYIVRQSNAHAWTEVWTPEDGWIRVDPISAVAPERIALGATGRSIAGASTIASRIGRLTLLRQASLAWDAVNTFWNDWVVGYGPALQRSFLEWLGFERPRWRQMLGLTVFAIIVLMLALAAVLGFRTRHTAAPDPASRLFARFMRELARYEIPPMSAGETATDYATRAATRLPAAETTIRSIATSYLEARYDPDCDGAGLARLESEVRAFRPRYARASR